MENPILAMIPSGYNAADAKLYSILPSDGSGDFTVSVDADATRVNKEGLIEGVALNQARLTYDPLNPECPSLLLEPTVTNFLNYSEDYTQSNWNKSGVTITSNATTSPSGNNNGSLMTATTTNGTLSDFNEWTTTTRTASLFVKKHTSSLIKIINGSTGENITFDLDIGEVTTSSATFEGSITSLANNWYRINAQHNTTSGTAPLGIRIPISGQSVYIWGAQIEDTIYKTSYVPTTNTSVTRTNDICKDAGNAALFNVSKLSLFIDVNNFKTNTGSFSYIVLTDGQNSPINMIRLDYTQNSISIRSYDNGTIKLSYDITSVVPNQRNKLLLTFDNNEAKTYFNGVLKNTSTSITIPSGLDSLSFTNRTESGGTFQGEVHDARVYDRVLTETEAIKLTTI
jgi:hypothetical protein